MGETSIPELHVDPPLLVSPVIIGGIGFSVVAGRDCGHLVAVDAVVEEEALNLVGHLLGCQLGPDVKELAIHGNWATP
jgi:hypothetical protein